MLDNLLFKQERIGKNKKPLTIYKIKTMDDGVDDDNVVEAMMRGEYYNKCRVTWLGAILRYLGLDEIPQIWNLLMGELQLVGFRPLRDKLFQKLPSDIQDFYLAHKPGLFPGPLAMGEKDFIKSARLYMQVVEKLNKSGEGHDTRKRLFILCCLLVRSYYYRLTDRAHIDVIIDKIGVDIFKTLVNF